MICVLGCDRSQIFFFKQDEMMKAWGVIYTLILCKYTYIYIYMCVYICISLF